MVNIRAEQEVRHQPARSFSISFQHLFNRAGGRTSNVRSNMLKPTQNLRAEYVMAKKLLRNVGIFGLAIGSLFLIVGLGVMGVAIKRGLKQQETSRWPTVQGEIVSTALTKSDHRSADSPLIYEYELDGHVYKSTRVVHIDRANIHYNDWVQLANGLPQTGSVTVYYNPSDPIESVIVAGDSKVSWNGLEFGAIFGGFAAFWMTAWWGMTHWLPNQLGRANRLSRKTKVQSGSEQAVPFDGHKPSNSAPSSDTTAPADAH